MSSGKTPNIALRQERDLRGWSQRRLAEEVGTTEGIVSRWERGERTPEPYYREKLCALFGKNAEELGFLGTSRSLYHTGGTNLTYRGPDTHMVIPKKLGLTYRMTDDRKPLPALESNDCFSFGKLQTTWMVLDGDGTESYLPQHIRTFYDPHPETILKEIQETKKEIEKEQIQEEKEGKAFSWNGDAYHCVKYVISRDPIHEHMKVSLWYKPTDYYTVLAKNRCLDAAAFREKYLLGHDWETLIPAIPTPSAVVLSLLSSDGHIILTQRGSNLAFRPGVFHASVAEGLSRPLDKSTTSQAPDFYRCACRGLSEELGIQENVDFVSSDIHFLSLGLDTQYVTCGLRGMIKVQKTANEIIKNWRAGVKDKMENKHLFAVPFTPQDVCDFVFSHKPWAPGGLICLYHTLVHEFGRVEVDRVIASY